MFVGEPEKPEEAAPEPETLSPGKFGLRDKYESGFSIERETVSHEPPIEESRDSINDRIEISQSVARSGILKKPKENQSRKPKYRQVFTRQQIPDIANEIIREKFGSLQDEAAEIRGRLEAAEDKIKSELSCDNI